MRPPAPALLPIFRSRTQAEILARVLLHPEQEFTLVQLTTAVNGSSPTVYREARRLADSGLLLLREVGRTHLLRANSAHPATEPLTRLLEVSYGALPVVAEEFALTGTVQVVIFGSWAARYLGAKGPPPNDIDVLVLGDTARADVYAAADRAQERLGLPVNPALRAPDQWDDGEDPLVAQIRAGAFVVAFADAAENGLES